MGAGVGTTAPSIAVAFRGVDRSAHPGVFAALDRMQRQGVLRGVTVAPIVVGNATRGLERYWRDLVAAVERDGSELVVLHHLYLPSPPDPRPYLEDLRALPQRPLIALTNGDAFYNGFFRPRLPPMFLQAAEAADVVLSTSMGALADLVVRRARVRTCLLPNGACQVRFGGGARTLADRPEFRVAFIGSNNVSRHPLRGHYWYGRRRQRLVRRLSERFGPGFAVFGRGWDGIPGWQGPVAFDEQQDACRRAQIVVGGVPYSSATYYMSNRPFIQIASGVPFVDIAVDGVERILRDGEHWHLASSVEEVVDRCDELLTRKAAERAELGARAAEYVLRRHTQAQRWRSLVTTLTALRSAVLERTAPEPPDLGFLLPEVDRDAELRTATRRWRAPSDGAAMRGSRRAAARRGSPEDGP